MKKNFAPKIALALVFVLIFSMLFTTVAFAADEEYVKWEFSDDETSLKNVSEDVSYSFFWNGVAIRPDPDSEYFYEQSMEYCGMEYLTVRSSPSYKDAVWIDSSYGNIDIFVTEKGAADLNDFASGKIGSFVIEDYSGARAEISKDTIAEWDAALRSGVGTDTFDVRDLRPSGKKVEVFDLIARDESGTFAYNCGAIYRMADGKYWYVNFSDLENNCFDANGYLSYRGGSIEMVLISDVTMLENALSDMEYRNLEYLYEWNGDLYIDDDFQNVFAVISWILYVALVIAPTIPLAALGIVLANLKKLGKPKYWYWLTASSALWLVAAIALAIVLIIAMI